jgi:excisionase family DNA binding protein
MTDAAEAPELLRVRQVAERYGLTERHVRQLVQERTIPYYKPGRIVLIDRAEFETWLGQQRVEAI